MGFGTNYAMNKYSRDIGTAISDWLYGDWNEEKLRQFQVAYSVPGVRDYLDYLLDRRADEEYLGRYGMDYSDIHDPRKLRQVSSGSRLIGSSYRMVSRNIDDLYDDFNSKHKKKK